MDVLSVTDQEDGSAIVELSMTEQEQNWLIQHAVTDLLQKAIARESRTCCDCECVIDDETIEKYPSTEICGECLEG